MEQWSEREVGKVLIYLSFLGCLVGTLLILNLAPEGLASWWHSTFRGDFVRWFPHLPAVLLGILALWGAHLRQRKIPLLALVLVSAHAALSLPIPHELSPGALREGLGIFIPWAFPLLLVLPERGMRSPWGWTRIAVLLCLWIAVVIWGWHRGFGTHWPALLAKIPGGLKSVSSGLAFFALWTLPLAGEPREARDCRASWTVALIALGLAFSQGEPWWPMPVRGSTWPVFLSFSAVFLLAGLYGLTWRRAFLDGLTGLPGRRAFEESLRGLGRRYAIAMVDVDHFKRFNDRYGHQVGDQVLRFVAARLKAVSFGRSFRYGGEEFALIMPGTGLPGVLSELEALRLSIASSGMTIRGTDRPARKPPRRARPRGGKQRVGVTVSIGVAQRSRLHATPEAVMKAADEALYRAKKTGRNRVEAEQRRQPR